MRIKQRTTYIITCSNGRKYVGASVNPSKRFADHMSFLKNGYHDSKLMQEDYNTLGRGAFTYATSNLEEAEVVAALKPEYNGTPDGGIHPGFRAHWKDPSLAAKMRKSLSDAANTPEAKQRRRETAKAMWAPGGALYYARKPE